MPIFLPPNRSIFLIIRKDSVREKQVAVDELVEALDGAPDTFWEDDYLLHLAHVTELNPFDDLFSILDSFNLKGIVNEEWQDYCLIDASNEGKDDPDYLGASCCWLDTVFYKRAEGLAIRHKSDSSDDIHSAHYYRYFAENSLEATADGILSIKDTSEVFFRGDRWHISLSRNPIEVHVLSKDKSNILQTALIKYGSAFVTFHGEDVREGQVIAHWDNDFDPILTHINGRVEFKNFIEDVTYTVLEDEFTGWANAIVSEPKNGELPIITITNPDTNDSIDFMIPAHAYIDHKLSNFINTSNQYVEIGDTIAKIPLPPVYKEFIDKKPLSPEEIITLDWWR